MPPAKILVAAVVDEFKIVANASGRTFDREVFEKNFVLWPLVVPRKRKRPWERPHPGPDKSGFTGIGAGSSVSQLKQTTFNLHHAAHAFNRRWRRLHRRIELIAQQMLDVVNQQLLMLHLVLESEPHNRKNLIRIIARRNIFNESRHLFIN